MSLRHKLRRVPCRSTLLRLFVVLLAFSALGAGCDDPGDVTPEPPGTTNPIPAATRAAQLLDQLAAAGGREVFDHRYVAYWGTDAALFIGTRADTAVAYLCDPVNGTTTWLGGSNDYGSLQLVAPSGVGFVGGTVSRTITGKLSGTKGRDGAVTLTETTDTVLQRDASATVEGGGRIIGPERRCG